MGTGGSALNEAPPSWRCPEHRVALIAEHGTLRCPRGETFAIELDIPRFVPRNSYAAAFAAQWKRYRRTQLDSFTGFPLSRDRARAVLGEAIWSRMQGMEVLECGCGAGRF